MKSSEGGGLPWLLKCWTVIRTYLRERHMGGAAEGPPQVQGHTPEAGATKERMISKPPTMAPMSLWIAQVCEKDREFSLAEFDQAAIH